MRISDKDTMKMALKAFEFIKHCKGVALLDPMVLSENINALTEAVARHDLAQLTVRQIADANGLEITDPFIVVALQITRNAEKAHGIGD